MQNGKNNEEATKNKVHSGKRKNEKRNIFLFPFIKLYRNRTAQISKFPN